MSVDIDAPDLSLLFQQKLRIVQYRTTDTVVLSFPTVAVLFNQTTVQVVTSWGLASLSRTINFRRLIKVLELSCIVFKIFETPTGCSWRNVLM